MTRIVAFALLACLVVGGAGAAIAHYADDSVDATELPEPQTIVRGGVTFTITQAQPLAAVAGADARAVTVYLPEFGEPGEPSCAALEPRAEVVSKSADAVRVASYAYVGEQTDGVQACALTQIGSGRTGYRPIQLRLDEPLAGRDLVDTTSGEAIGMLDPTYAPEPAYVPKGYDLEQVTRFVPEDSFVAGRRYLNSALSGSIEIRVRSRSAWHQDGKVIGHEEVAGVSATMTEGKYERCLSWSPRRGLIFEVCDDLAGIDTTTATLARVAQSIPPLG